MRKKLFLASLLFCLVLPVWRLDGVETPFSTDGSGLYFPKETYETMFSFLYWFPGTVVKPLGQEAIPTHFCNIMVMLEYAAKIQSLPPSLRIYVKPSILGEIPDSVRIWEHATVKSLLETSKPVSEEKFLYKYRQYVRTERGQLQSRLVAGRCGAVITDCITALLNAGKAVGPV
ncbi:MAG: hypothetical protein M1549_01020 [Candidatus Dependentiae bacterium]|nr:hypothetical protein [Candidatus Dependentiae bacterium]